MSYLNQWEQRPVFRAITMLIPTENLEKLKIITTGAIGRPLWNSVSGFRKVTVNAESIEHVYCTIED